MEGYRSKQLVYDGSNLILYKGYNLKTQALDSDPDWEIIKFTYDGTNIVKTQKATGTWTSRASLSW
jgi:hypothetical protein